MRQRSWPGREGAPRPLPRAVTLPDESSPRAGTVEPTTPPAPIPIGPTGQATGLPRPILVGRGSASAGTQQAPPASIPIRPANAPILLTQQQKQRRGVAGTDRRWVRRRGWRPGRKAVGVREELTERAEEGAAALVWRRFIQEHRSWAVSAAFHAVLVLILGLMTFAAGGGQVDLVSLADTTEDLESEGWDVLRTDGLAVEDTSRDIVDRVEPESLQPMIDLRNASEGIDAGSVQLSDFGLEQAPYNDLLTELGTGTGRADARGTGKGTQGTGFGLDGAGGGFGGRGGRRTEALKRGATKESEEAVDLALKWLAEHQLPDGSWSYDHHQAPSCQGKCPNPGQMPEAKIAATSMGVLPFLGAGQTNQVGQYQRTVAAGLTYLMRRMELRPEGGSLVEPGGQMYGHGLATIALCEAYAMQVDPRMLRRLRPAYDGSGRASPGEVAPKVRQEAIPLPDLGRAAQAALDYVAYAQDPVGGGWRYQPRQPGDTSMVGWQLMAWMSGKMSYLRVSPATAVGAAHYLDHVQLDEYGSDYAYLDKNQATKATQAIGLLCRMYLGWPRDHAAITRGVEQMSQSGPVPGYMYYDYYATQVLHHYGGELWERWNTRMRDSLVNSQSKAGHTAGSWHFPGGDHGADKGGRLYCTSLAAQTLEVYYRHMPLYGKDVLKHAAVAGDGGGPRKKQDGRADGDF